MAPIRRFPSRHITAGPSRPVTALRAARLPHCTAQRPRHRCLFYHAICQPYTLKSVFAKHQKITKICPLTSFDMFRDRTLVFISYMKSVAARKWQIRQRGGACIFDGGIRRSLWRALVAPWEGLCRLCTRLSVNPHLSVNWLNWHFGRVRLPLLGRRRKRVYSSGKQLPSGQRPAQPESFQKRRSSKSVCREMYKKNWALRHKSSQIPSWPKFNRPVAAKCCQGTCHISWKPNFPGIGFGPRDSRDRTAGTIAVKDQATY